MLCCNVYFILIWFVCLQEVLLLCNWNTFHPGRQGSLVFSSLLVDINITSNLYMVTLGFK